MPPLTDISVRRSLKGVNQADAQFTLIVTNNRAEQVRTGYLETMPWHLQFYLHTLHADVNGAPRGKSRQSLPAVPSSWSRQAVLPNLAHASTSN